MSKEVLKSEVITSEVVDKFHRALCPQCNGRCFHGMGCRYDYYHKEDPKPHVNEVWEKYVNVLSEKVKEYNITLDEAFDILTSVKPLTEDKLTIKCEMEALFNTVQ